MPVQTLAEISERYNDLRIMIPASVRAAYDIDERTDRFICKFTGFYRRSKTSPAANAEETGITLTPYFSFEETSAIKVSGPFGVLEKSGLVQKYGFLVGDFVAVQFDYLQHNRRSKWWFNKGQITEIPIFPARMVVDIPPGVRVVEQSAS